MSVTRMHWIRDEPPLFSSITGQRTTVADSTRTDRLPRIKEFVEVVAIYVALALLGQFTAIPPGNVTPIYPAAGFAMACVLMRGPRVWPAIWLGQLLGNMWAFVDFSHTGAALTTSGAGAVTASGAALQALVGAYLIKTVCGAGSPLTSCGVYLRSCASSSWLARLALAQASRVCRCAASFVGMTTVRRC